MSENVELAHAAAAAFNRRDLNVLLALIDAGVEFVPLHAEMEGGDSYKGHEGVRIWWADLLSVFQDFRVQVVEVTAVGNATVTRLCISGQGTDSGAPVEQTNWQVTEWLDGKAVRWRTFRSEAEALEAAGLQD